MQATFIGKTPLNVQNSVVSGEYVTIDGQKYYKISHSDQMKPFFMSLVSHSDHWLFISSTGGLTAGRQNEHSALFPYTTDDKLADDADRTGSKSILRVETKEGLRLWEPFSDRYEGAYSIRRNLYKNDAGNHILFEEENLDLGLSFRYGWTFSEKYGFVRNSKLTNTSESEIRLELVDGIQNVLPCGISPTMQKERSNLTHAYKKNELDVSTGLGMFMLSAFIVDKAEPSEALKCTTVWSEGIDVKSYLLSSSQLTAYRKGQALVQEDDVKAEKGSYLINAEFSLASHEDKSWSIVAEVNQDHSKVHGLLSQLGSNNSQLVNELTKDVKVGLQSLKRLVGMSDGLQKTADELMVGRHYSNVLFNNMRGGIFEDQYLVYSDNLRGHIVAMNAQVAEQQKEFLDDLPNELTYSELIRLANENGDADIIRLCYEYLPLSFSRRHGDPSRPWNKFSIEIKKEDGSKNQYYEGNWRDIFQNWEALAMSFPEFIESMIAKFVNASTIDGYNPYRITSDGIDWEVIEPDDDWSFIGYWGDHQIIYLLRLLELSRKYNPEKLNNLMQQEIFVYANVPYRIKKYQDIIKDPQDTIDFDHDIESETSGRVSYLGADGKLVWSKDGKVIWGKDGQPMKTTLVEKLLLTLLTKLSNFVPEAGIWLNTQRPEWNDANNALVGNGASMVTLYYIRRYLAFLQRIISGHQSFQLNATLYDLFQTISQCFNSNEELLSSGFTDQQRKAFVDELGMAGETYREAAYEGFVEDKMTLDEFDLQSFIDMALRYMEHTIAANKRNDNLYHSYNLIDIDDDSIRISHLYEMLEGQVAVLTSGVITPEETLQILDALKSSEMYREDQYSYMLYPNRTLSRFLDKNNIPKEFADNSQLAQALIADGDETVLTKDVNGNYHFSGDFNNANSLKTALDALKGTKFSDGVEAEYDSYLETFEEMFDHKAFTGRSGTFFGYEGLGSIYWHMVSKLLLATQEAIVQLSEQKDYDQPLFGKLVDHYFEIRAGIGINKSPDLYGAFPTDPYSHTPSSKGAQQPGMTGQVKEDVISRWAELGVKVNDGEISFEPTFLSKEEYLKEPSLFEYFDIHGEKRNIELKSGQLAFTYGQVPVIYNLSNEKGIELSIMDWTQQVEGSKLDKEHSSHIFARNGKIAKIVVNIPK